MFIFFDTQDYVIVHTLFTKAKMTFKTCLN